MAQDIIDKLTAVGLKANWGLVDRMDGAPEPFAVIRDTITEITALRNALHEACDVIEMWSEHCPKWYFTEACDRAEVDCEKRSSACWSNYFLNEARNKIVVSEDTTTSNTADILQDIYEYCYHKGGLISDDEIIQFAENQYGVALTPHCEGIEND